MTSGCLTKIILGSLGVIISAAFGFSFDFLVNPWAYSLTGKPILPGTYIGQVTSHSGQTRELFLDLHRSNSGDGYSNCNTCSRIDGKAQMCGDGGEVLNYEIWGGPYNWSGSRFHLSTRHVGEGHLGLQAGGIRGEWTGDTLNVGMIFSLQVKKGGVVYSADPDLNVPVKFTMVRGSEADFLSACRELDSLKQQQRLK